MLKVFTALLIFADFVMFGAVAQQQQEQQADPKLLQTGLAVLQAQRNRAMDEAANAEAQLAKAQQEIADLKKQIDDSKQEKHQ